MYMTGWPFQGSPSSPGQDFGGGQDPPPPNHILIQPWQVKSATVNITQPCGYEAMMSTGGVLMLLGPGAKSSQASRLAPPPFAATRANFQSP